MTVARGKTWLLSEDVHGKVNFGPGMRSRGEPRDVSLEAMLAWLAENRFVPGDTVVVEEHDGYRVNVTHRVQRKMK